MASLDAVLSVLLQGRYTPTSADVFGATQKALSHTASHNISTGTGSNQADLIFTNTYTITTGGTTIDLAGSLADPFGTTLTFVKIMAMLLYNKSATTGEYITVGNAASNQWASWLGGATNTVKLGPGGILLLTSPIDAHAVTAGTGDQLKFIAATGSIQMDAYFLGRSA